VIGGENAPEKLGGDTTSGPDTGGARDGTTGGGHSEQV